ncbi:Hypothetical predicted protein, partial [Pelobates cultripes]
LEMDYVELLNSCQPQGIDTEQESWLGDPDLPTYSWENAAEVPPASLPAAEVGDLIDWSWEDPQMA